MHFYAVNIDGSNEIDLTPFENVKATIVDDLDDDPEHVILGLNKRNEQIFDPYRVNVNTGEMEMPDGSKLPATGKKVDFQGVQVVEFKDGKMYKGSQYYNPMVMMEQLGLMPS